MSSEGVEQKMHVLMLTLGTRGDVQPFVALGIALQAAGHDVTVCAPTTFEEFVTTHGLGYQFMNDEIVQMIDTDVGRAAIEDSDSIIGWLKTARDLMGQVKPMMRRMFDECWAAADATIPDVIVYHPKAIAGYHIAERLQIPGMLAAPLPIGVPTTEYPAVILPNLPLGGWYNKLTHHLVDWLTGLQYGGLINDWRRDSLGLPARSRFAGELKRSDGRPVPVLHAYSRHVLPPPPDWPDSAHVTGYWFLDRVDTWEPPADLVDFLAAGPPPVYVGFGSIAGRDPAGITRSVINALDQSDRRGIIATGWGGLQTEDLPDGIFSLDEAPHDWLFPRMAAVVHHGGAGTTAAGLRAGVPTVICPFFGDQPFWGRRVAELGVGAQPIPQKQLTADNLAEAIRYVTTDKQVRRRATELGVKIRAERGVQTAIDIIKNYVGAMSQPTLQPAKV